MLDPQAAALLKLLQDNRVPPVNLQTPAQAREAYLARRTYSQPDPPEVGEVLDHEVQANGVHFKVRSYQPPGRSAALLPALVYYHGGGWTMGSKESSALTFLPWLEMGWSVVNVEYRLTNVSLAPAAVEARPT